MLKNCVICGKEFEVFGKSKKRITCNLVCRKSYNLDHRRKSVKHGLCIVCGKQVNLPKQFCRVCGIKNHWKENTHWLKGKKGSKGINWKGGKSISEDGYVLIYALNHPHASVGNKYVFEHRLMMEKYLGRYLSPEEIVHHINGIRSDNRIENLKLLSRSEHNREHGFGGDWRK